MSTSKDIQRITQFAGQAIVAGFSDEIVRLNEVVAFDLRFNLRHPKIAAIYMLETPINGCHFEVVKRDGNRYHVGGDIAARILGEEKAYMSTLENIATQAKEQTGLIKQFCRKCNLFEKLYPDDAREQQMKDRAKAMEEQYINQAGGIMARLSKVDTAIPELPVTIEPKTKVSTAVAERLHSKLRANCEIQFAVAQAHISKWVDFLSSKINQVLSYTENFKDTDPTGVLKFEALGGKISLLRNGEIIGEWDNYEQAYAFMKLGLNQLPNPVLPITKVSYDRTVEAIPVDEAVLKRAISAQVGKSICSSELWVYLNS